MDFVDIARHGTKKTVTDVLASRRLVEVNLQSVCGV